MNTAIDQLHSEYCRLIQGQLKLTLDRQYWWGQWKARGFTMDDLRLVIRHLQTGIKNGKRFPGSLKWSHLIQQADAFEEELIEAKAQKRNAKPPPTPKAIVQQQWSKTVAEPVSTNTRSVGELISRMRAAVNENRD